MNVSNYAMNGFKEFEAFQQRHFAPSSPFVEPSNESISPRRVTPIDFGDFSMKTMRDVASVRQLMQGGRASAFNRSQAHQGWGNRFARGHEYAEPKMQLDSRSFQRNHQSTELTIQTKDGDTVTINIKEQSMEKAQSRVKITDAEDGERDRASVKYQGKESSSEAFDLQAVFEGNEVSDVSFEKEWASTSADKIKVSSTADGVTTEASYRSNTYTAGSLEFEVDGSLDADELKAIGDLLSGVDALSQTFFDGDVTKAFEQAMNLGYDKSEIAGYALELRENELSVEEQKYRAAGALGKPEQPKGMLRPIGEYAYQLKSLETLDRKQFEGQILEQLMEQVDKHLMDLASEQEERETSRFASQYGLQQQSFSSFSMELLQQIQSFVFQAA